MALDRNLSRQGIYDRWRSCRSGVFFGTIVFASGCAETFVPSDRQRADSFAPYAANSVDGTKLAKFIEDRIALIYSGAKLSDLRRDFSSGKSRISLSVDETNPAGWSEGTLTPIDARGYFVTAAHCIRHEPISVLWWDADAPNGGEFRMEEDVKVIWRGDFEKGEPDLAIVRINRHLAHIFYWSGIFASGDAVLAEGINHVGAGTRPAYIAGKIRGNVAGAALPNGQRCRVISHDAPLHKGDSGGPLLTVEGKLLGINTDAGYGIRKLSGLATGEAIRPDVDWVVHIIEEDFARRQ